MERPMRPSKIGDDAVQTEKVINEWQECQNERSSEYTLHVNSANLRRQRKQNKYEK